MGKQQPAKRKFDWTSYTKPSRILTPEQEDALSGGVLAPLLDTVTSNPDLRMEIRARSVNVYFRGANLLRISGNGPFVGELDGAYREPRTERTGERLIRIEIAEKADMLRCLDLLEELRGCVVEAWDAATDFGDRSARQIVASANSGRDLFTDEYVVIDIEYTYGQRRYDLVALERTEGVTGPGGFANCQLAFVDLRRTAKGLSGSNGLAALGGDLAEFAKAVGGTHYARARSEFEALVAQKVRLGLLPPELELRRLEDAAPRLLVMFGNPDVFDAEHDAAIVELHEKLAARHFPTEQLRFVHVDAISDAGACPPTIREGDALPYRDFKSYRRRGRQESAGSQ